MTDTPKDRRRAFHGILDGICEYLEHAPEEELLEDARAAGEGPAEIAARVRQAFLELTGDDRHTPDLIDIKQMAEWLGARWPLRASEYHALNLLLTYKAAEAQEEPRMNTQQAQQQITTFREMLVIVDWLLQIQALSPEKHMLFLRSLREIVELTTKVHAESERLS
jgi:hypothetical protein